MRRPANLEEWLNTTAALVGMSLGLVGVVVALVVAVVLLVSSLMGWR